MSQRGSQTINNFSRGFLDAWSDHPIYRPLRVRRDPEYQRGYAVGCRERDEVAWLHRPFNEHQSAIRQGTSGRQKANRERFAEFKAGS